MTRVPPPPDPAEPPVARFSVGIDLGTTHSALAYWDARQASPRLRDFAIPQLVGPGETESRPVLPSFHYEPLPGEFPPGSLRAPGVPEGEYVVGWFARRHGAATPGRLVASAKSWLCHAGVDRTAPLLPWHGAQDVTRLSPVEASARYLSHLRAAWDSAFPDHPLADQEVVVTVPASFDEVARQLTLRAADKAGLPRVTLLEEPQAAFYAWMAACDAAGAPPSESGSLTLICDVGGGTTDFTLIEARPAAESRARFHRVAVGDHLILGGDNMDLALAHHLEARLAGGERLDPARWNVLVQQCRHAKEVLLGANAPERLGLAVSRGARLLGGSLQSELDRKETIDLLVEGFFPRVPLNARPASARSGFQEFGLPYAADPAITRHLAAFLADHLQAAEAPGGHRRFPDRVLFNGGVFESPALRQRLLEVLESWRREAGSPGGAPMQVLPNDRLDLAVARGAAYAAWLRRQPGRRIAAGLARAYYLVVSRPAGEPPAAVCLAPAGLEEGQDVTVPQRFTLRIRQPVEFTLLTSSTRLQDQPGAVVLPDPDHFHSLPPIRTVVGSQRSGELASTTAEVQVQARLNEIGTLDLRCVDPARQRSWRLEFDVRGSSRSAPRTSPAALPQGREALEDELIAGCRTFLDRTFAPTAAMPPLEPASLVRALEDHLALPRHQWPLPLLRALWEALMEREPGRRRGVLHEARWLNLLGFALRPGFGFPVDDWRVQQTWRLHAHGTVQPKNEMCRAEWWVLWRRVAGGLTAAHQRALADRALAASRAKGGKGLPFGPHETSELWRLLASLELLPVPFKVELGQELLDRLERRLETPVERAALWALGRLGARVPVYGPLNALIPADTADAWLARILQRPTLHEDSLFAVTQLARPTGDRYRDLPESARLAALRFLEQHGADPHQCALVREGGAWNAAEEEQAFGESLPPGLHLANSDSTFPA